MVIKTLVGGILKARSGGKPDANFGSLRYVCFHTQPETKSLPVALIFIIVLRSPLGIMAQPQVSVDIYFSYPFREIDLAGVGHFFYGLVTGLFNFSLLSLTFLLHLLYS